MTYQNKSYICNLNGDFPYEKQKIKNSEIKNKMSSLNQNTNIMWSTIGKNTCPVRVNAFTEAGADKGTGVSHEDLYEIR